VFLEGIASRDIRRILWHIERLGFKEVWISPDRAQLPSERVIVETRLIVRQDNERPPPGRENGPPGNPDTAEADPAVSSLPLVEPAPDIPPVPEKGELYVFLDKNAKATPETAEADPAVSSPPLVEPAPDIPAVPEKGELYVFLDKNAKATPDTAEAGPVVSSPPAPPVPDIPPVSEMREPYVFLDKNAKAAPDMAEADPAVSSPPLVESAPDIPAVPEKREPYVFLDKNAKATPGTAGLAEYQTDQNSRLAYRFVNPRGNSGSTGGIDILGKGPNDVWMWITYGQGGFSYNLNGRRQTMTNGVLRSSSGIELRVEPSFVDIDGAPGLQLEHKLKNTGKVPVSGQKFGAGADIMIHNNDHVPIALTDYGLSMADGADDAIAGMELRFIAKSGRDISPVSTLRIGPWEQGAYLEYMYENGVCADYSKESDSAMTFSYQDITLAPGETKSFTVRFELGGIPGGL
jgi:hypothetical protein